VWRDLLGEEGFNLARRIARERSEDVDMAATRLWAALECRKKVGLPVESPLVLESVTPDGWALLRSGALVIPTCIAAIRGMKAPLVIAVALNWAAGNAQLRAVARDMA
jgi:enediyne polyketide synthase